MLNGQRKRSGIGFFGFLNALQADDALPHRYTVQGRGGGKGWAEQQGTRGKRFVRNHEAKTEAADINPAPCSKEARASQSVSPSRPDRRVSKNLQCPLSDPTVDTTLFTIIVRVCGDALVFLFQVGGILEDQYPLSPHLKTIDPSGIGSSWNWKSKEHESPKGGTVYININVNHLATTYTALEGAVSVFVGRSNITSAQGEGSNRRTLIYCSSKRSLRSRQNIWWAWRSSPIRAHLNILRPFFPSSRCSVAAAFQRIDRRSRHSFWRTTGINCIVHTDRHPYHIAQILGSNILSRQSLRPHNRQSSHGRRLPQ